MERACAQPRVRPGERASPGALRLPRTERSRAESSRAEPGAGRGPARGGGGGKEGLEVGGGGRGRPPPQLPGGRGFHRHRRLRWSCCLFAPADKRFSLGWTRPAGFAADPAPPPHRGTALHPLLETPVRARPDPPRFAFIRGGALAWVESGFCSPSSKLPRKKEMYGGEGKRWGAGRARGPIWGGGARLLRTAAPALAKAKRSAPPPDSGRSGFGGWNPHSGPAFSC